MTTPFNKNISTSQEGRRIVSKTGRRRPLKIRPKTIGIFGYCPNCGEIMEYIGFGSAWQADEFVCGKCRVRVKVSKI